MRGMSLLCIISILPHHPHFADEGTEAQRGLWLAQGHVADRWQGRSLSQTHCPRAYPGTVPLLQSPFPSLRVEIVVYPIFYEQVSKEASRMCVSKPANSKIQHLLGNLASHPPAWL